jgi:hypothetical protein
LFISKNIRTFVSKYLKELRMKKLIPFLMVLFIGVCLQAQQVIYVAVDSTGNGTSWSDASNIEQAMIKASAAPGSQVWVRRGTYKLTKTLVIPDSTTVYGGFWGSESDLSLRNFLANPSIIDAQEQYGPVVRLDRKSVV